jgi:hypothetical protein
MHVSASGLFVQFAIWIYLEFIETRLFHLRIQNEQSVVQLAHV